MRKVRSRDMFVSDAVAIHGKDSYNYDNIVYVNMRTKLDIFCNIHNKNFTVSPSKHINSKQGCQLCSYTKHRSEAKVKDTTYFVTKAKSIHGNLYCYDNTTYKRAKDKVAILCNSCNVEFLQKAANHLSGKGCPKCSHDRGMSKQRSSTAEFIKAAKLIHGNTIDYSLVSYGKSNTDKVIVVCNTCNIKGFIAPTSLLLGALPSCSCPKHHGFQDCKPGIVYYLSLNNGEAYKIGITNRSVNERFNRKDLSKIQVIQTWNFENGYDARALETSILRKFKHDKYTGPDILHSGNSELFSTDILSSVKSFFGFT